MIYSIYLEESEYNILKQLIEYERNRITQQQAYNINYVNEFSKLFNKVNYNKSSK